MRYYEGNPRRISAKQYERLRQDLAGLGDLGGIVHDLNSDQVIGGNQRTRALGLLIRKPVIVKQYDPPTKTGTVAEGYFEIDGERFAYRAVRWTPEQCAAANIKANLDGGSWDFDALAGWDVGELQAWGFDSETLATWNDDAANLRTMLSIEDGTDAPDLSECGKSIADGVDTITCPQCGCVFPK
jgi:hypothetical protein